jgi:tetratricopeptide (TPR) repeat protein
MSNIFHLFKRTQTSYRILLHCARNAPRSGEVLIEMGKIMMTAGQPAAALRCLQRATQLDGRNPQAFYLMGRTYLALHNEVQGLSAWRKALMLAPQLVTLRHDIGVICLRRGRYREAAGEFEQVLQRWPQDGEVRYLLALALKESGDPAQAIPHLEEVVRGNPRHLQALYLLGACHLQLGQSMTGIAYLQQYDQLRK